MIDIRISVQPSYLPDQSHPEQQTYVFAYQITLTNRSPVVAQLLRRSWRITDGTGQVQEVHGDGVVGMQPRLEASGGTFQYSSHAILSTPIGWMEGFYEFTDTTGSIHQVPIARFTLVVPGILN